MIAKEKQLAIAEAHGWTEGYCEVAKRQGDKSPSGRWYYHTRHANGQPRKKPPTRRFQFAPNYLSDLNAMRDALETLGPADFEKYRWILWGMCKQPLVSEWQRAYLTASAAKQADAFLETLELL